VYHLPALQLYERSQPRMNKLATLFLFFCLTWTACSDDDDFVRKNTALNIDATIHSTVISKQSFIEDDRIGVYLVSYNGNSPGTLGDIDQTTEVNVEYSYDNSGFWYSSNGTDIFLNEGLSDLYAYHPYDEGMSFEPGKTNLTAYPFKVELNQHIASDHSDFLWAKVPALSETNFTAPIVFQHLMCRNEINIRLADGIAVNSTPELKVYNTRISCTINMRNGQVTPGTDNGIIIPSLNPVTTPGFDYTYDAILIPQFIESGTPIFTIDLDGNTYVYELPEDMDMIAQENYKFNLVAGPVPSARNSISVVRITE